MSEIISKVSEYHAKITTTETIVKERTYSLAELLQHKSAAETALASWEQARVNANLNIEIQTEQIAEWQRIIDELIKVGVKEEVATVDVTLETLEKQ
jgi:CRISPR/Cas system-associated protein Cas5 (RAMP superfamily)